MAIIMLSNPPLVIAGGCATHFQAFTQVKGCLSSAPQPKTFINKSILIHSHE